MEEKDKIQFNESIEPLQSNNYLLSVIFAIIGGSLGVVIWLIPVYFFEYILYITVIIVGLFAASGARLANNKQGGIVIALIAILATAACILVGDWLETSVILGTLDFQIDNYMEYINLKFGQDPEQLFYYLGAVAVAGFTGFAKNKDAV